MNSQRSTNRIAEFLRVGLFGSYNRGKMDTQANPKGVAWTAADLRNPHSRSDKAGRVPVPTIWLWGERDRVVDPTVTARVAPRTPRAELHPQPGLCHEIFNEREPEREQLLGKVDAWLRARC